MNDIKYLFFDLNLIGKKVNDDNFNTHYYKYICRKIGNNQCNKIYYIEKNCCLSREELLDYAEKYEKNSYVPCNFIYFINNELENFRDLFFFPFSLILKNSEEDFSEYIYQYLNKFLESKEQKLSILYNGTISKLKKYNKIEEQFLGIDNHTLLEEDFQNIFERYLKGIFIKLTLETLACKEYRDKIEQLKALYSYMNKKNWFKFCILEIKSFLKNYYTNDNSNFDFKNIDTFIFFLEKNCKDNSDFLYNDIATTLLLSRFGFDFNLDLNFIIEEYIKFFDISLIMIDKDIDLENNRNIKTMNKKIKFLNCIFEYYFNKKEITQIYNLSERQINLLTNKKILDSVENYRSVFFKMLKSEFSKESFEDIRYNEISEDSLHLIISKLWLNYDSLSYDIKLQINKSLLRIINLIRKVQQKSSYKARQLENNKYLENFKLEIIKFSHLPVGVQNKIYKSLLKINELLAYN